MTPRLMTISLTSEQADLLNRLLERTIIDTGSNKTARQCRQILDKLIKARDNSPVILEKESSP